MFGKDKDKDKDDAPPSRPTPSRATRSPAPSWAARAPRRLQGRVPERHGHRARRGRSESRRQTVLNAVRGVGGVTAVTDALTIGGASTGTPGAKPFGTGAGTRSYTVVSGDTLSKIAKQHYAQRLISTRRSPR